MAPLKQKDPFSLQESGYQAAGMAGDSGGGKKREIAVGDDGHRLDLLGQGAETRTEDDGDIDGVFAGQPSNSRGGAGQSLGVGHGRPARSFCTRNWNWSGLKDLTMKSSAPLARTWEASTSLR